MSENYEKKKGGNLGRNVLIGLIVLSLGGGLLISAISGGSSNTTPVEEEKAAEYQVIGSQLGVNWQWILLINMYAAEINEDTDISEQNPIETVLNCLKVSIDVYEYVSEVDEFGNSVGGDWEYSYTDYLEGAAQITEYFELSGITDINIISSVIEKKNSDRYRVHLSTYESLSDVLSLYYSFNEETVAEILEMDEENYFMELYGDALGGSIGDGIFGSGEIGDVPYPAIGMKIPLYLQYQSPWGAVRFGGGNIASSGCSITCMSMVFTYLHGDTVTPDQMAAWAGSKYYVGTAGQSWSIFPAAAKKWEVSCTPLGTNMQAVLSALSNGKPVIASMRPGTFTKAGHFIVLRGITPDGRILVNDPNDNSSTKNFFNRSFDVALIQRESKQFWCFY